MRKRWRFGEFDPFDRDGKREMKVKDKKGMRMVVIAERV